MLINLRNALMTGKRLPYDAEVEYLQSSGTQYIDTGIKPGPNTRVEITFAMTTFTANCGLFGARGNTTSWDNSYNLFIISNSGARVRWDWSGSGQYQTSEAETSTDATYVLGAARGNITRNGTTVMSVSASKAAINYPLYVFNFNNVGTPYSTGANARFWSVKIYDGQTLVFDAIPVRKKTVGYLYDRVSGKLFGNAGTGDFVLGQDVVPVEYIESHGTEYIDTGMYLTADFEYDLKFRMNTPLTSGTKSFGLQYHTWDGSYPMWCVGLSSYNKPRVWVTMTAGGNPGKGVDIGWGYDADITMSLHGNTLTYNGADTTFVRWGNSETSLVTMKIFVEQRSRYGDGGGLVDYAYARCYFLDLYSGNGNSQKLRPIRVGTEGAMMDTLTRRIYRNAGTGAFAYGNDLKYPIPA